MFKSSPTFTLTVESTKKMVYLPSRIDTVIGKDQIEYEYLRIPKLALRMIGFWPQDKLFDCKVFPLLCASLSIIFLGVIAEVGFAYTHVAYSETRNLLLALDGLCPALTKGVTVIKFVVLFLTRDKVSEMLDECKLKWMNDKLPECSYRNLRATRIANIFAMMLLVFSTCASTGYSLRPVGSMLAQYYSGKEVIRELPFKSEYPYDEFKDPMYEISYVFIALTGNIAVFGLCGMDGTFIALCLHISAQFEIVEHDFRQLTPTVKNAHHDIMIKYSASENEELHKSLKAIIRRHQEAIDMHKRMVALFTINIFSHFVSAALVICCVSVNLLMATDVAGIVYVCYGIAGTTQLYVYCAGGTYLQEASYSVSTAAYFTDWYKLDVRNQRLIQLVILRAQTPCAVTVPFFQSSVATFTTIMRSAGSYIALFRKVIA